MQNLYLNCFVFKQKTAYEMRISDWSSDVCSSDLEHREPRQAGEDSAVDPRAEEMAVAGQAAFPFLIECVLINGAEIGALAPVRGQQVEIVTPDDRIIGCRPPTDPGPLADRTERRGRFGPRRSGHDTEVRSASARKGGG